jgi:hypothetical protein
VPLVILGAGILWFGWFGFNAGSAGSGGALATSALVNTQLGAAAGMVVWMVVEWIARAKPSGVGLATGAVAGLAAITSPDLRLIATAAGPTRAFVGGDLIAGGCGRRVTSSAGSDRTGLSAFAQKCCGTDPPDPSLGAQEVNREAPDPRSTILHLTVVGPQGRKVLA